MAMLQRKRSEESLSTLLTTCTTQLPRESDSDAVSDDQMSLYSGDTLSAASLPVFRARISTYTRIRELPVVSGKSSLLLYPSVKALAADEAPLFLIQLNKLHFLKKNAPLLTTYKHAADGLRTEFCKTYFKVLLTNLTCYVLMFGLQSLVLFNNALKPHCDVIYKDTKLRVYGALGAASAFGNGLIKMFVLGDDAPSLADALDDDLRNLTLIRDFHPERARGGGLFDAVVGQRRNEVSRILSLALAPVLIPFATFFDHGGKKVDGIKVQGSLRLFESVGDSDDFTEDTLVLATMMLTLVEQEMLKMRGNNRPSYVGSVP